MLPLFAGTNVIDLSRPITDETPSYPGDPPLVINSIARVPEDGYQLEQWSGTFHTGTHMDAPGHFVDEGAMIIDLDSSYWGGSAWKIRIPHGTNPDLAHLEACPPPPDTAFLLIETGWDHIAGPKGYFSGHPVWTPNLIAWLAASTLKGIGMDTPSPDVNPFPAHKAVLGNGKVLLEGLFDLSRVPTGIPFSLLCIPIPVLAGAIWVRPLALVDAPV